MDSTTSINLAFFIQMGIVSKQSVDIRQQDQKICTDQRRHHGGQRIVVAELDLIGGDGVILIDDGNGTQF